MQPHPHIRFDKTYAQSGSLVAGSFPDLAALKTHLRIDYSSEDTYLNTLWVNASLTRVKNTYVYTCGPMPGVQGFYKMSRE